MAEEREREQPLTPAQERLAEASGHRFDPGDHDPALIDDDHLCHECGHPRRLHVSEVEVGMPWTCDVCGTEISTRAEAVEHAQTELHRVSSRRVAVQGQTPPASHRPADDVPTEPEVSPAEAEVLASGTARTTTTPDPFERGYQQGYAYARWRKDIKRPDYDKEPGVIRQVDYVDWAIRIVLLIVGLLLGFAVGHFL